MADHIISPDGKFMWTGSEWIPAPPAATPEIPPMIDLEAQSVDVRDSVVMGDINQNITQNISQVNTDEIVEKIVLLLNNKNITGIVNTQQEELPENKQTDILEALSLSESARAQGAKIDSFTELRLGDAASKTGNWTLALEHWNRIIEGDSHQIDAEILINAMINTAGYYIIHMRTVGKDWLKNVEMADKILHQALHHSRKNNNKKMEVFTLMKLSECVYTMSRRINAEYFNTTNDFGKSSNIISPLYSPIHSWEKDYVDCIEKTVNFLDSALLVATELSDSELQALVKCNKSYMLTELIDGFNQPLTNQVPRLLLWEEKILLANIESDIQFVLDVATMHTNVELKCKAYEVLAWVHYLRGESNDAKRYNNMSLEIYNSIPHGKRFPRKLFPRM